MKIVKITLEDETGRWPPSSIEIGFEKEGDEATIVLRPLENGPATPISALAIETQVLLSRFLREDSAARLTAYLATAP